MKFFGRRRELETLAHELDQVESGGRCVLLRGRRRVGKSRLIEKFCEQSGVQFLYFAATGVPVAAELTRFTERVNESTLVNRQAFTNTSPTDWSVALRLLSLTLPDDSPSIVVLDEVPFLVASDPHFEGRLQEAWDQVLSKKPVLLLLVGSDLSMMEALNTYGRPFFGRGAPMRLDPLNPAEVATMLKLAPGVAFDAYLITGGMPAMCAAWPSGATPPHALAEMLRFPTSPLVVSAELSLLAEFPPAAQATAVLTAIGHGERTYALIQRAAGDMAQASLSRALEILIEKRLVAMEQPLSIKSSKQTRYRIEDSHLRFWLTFIGPYLDELDRQRTDLVLNRINAGWLSWRGRAVEPVIREALMRLITPDSEWLNPKFAAEIGSYWTRTNSVELDLVGADRKPVARNIGFVGSIKWHQRQGFDHHELAKLINHRAQLPGADEQTPLVAVTRVGSAAGVAAHYTAADLIQAWGGST